jgi:hypothetical protein
MELSERLACKWTLLLASKEIVRSEDVFTLTSD